MLLWINNIDDGAYSFSVTTDAKDLKPGNTFDVEIEFSGNLGSLNDLQMGLIVDTDFFPGLKDEDLIKELDHFKSGQNWSNQYNLTAYDNSGKVIDTKSISLSAHEKMVDNPKNIFSKNIDKATYISYSSDHELVGFQLNCSPDASDDMMLDGLPGLFAGSSDSSCKNVLLSDDFSGSLTTNWTTGTRTNKYNNPPRNPTVKIVDGEVKYSQLYDYIETRKSFSGNFKVQMDVSRLIGSHGCADYYVELVGLNRVAAIMRFSYGLDAKESINIGRPPVDGETGAGTFDCIRDPSYLEELDHHGEAKGVLTLTYDTGKVQVSYTNDEGDTITTLWMSTGTFSSTKVRIWGLGSKGGERYIDNVKIISLCGTDGDDGGDNSGGDDDGGGDGGSCSNSVTFKLNGQSTTIPIFDMGESGFLLGYGDFYACHFSPTSSSGATQLFINDIPNTVSAGKTYAYTEEDVSTDGAISILWENNMYVGVNCTTTFTKWEGDGGNAEGTFSAEVYSPVSGKTMMITDGSFCAPIHDTY